MVRSKVFFAAINSTSHDMSSNRWRIRCNRDRSEDSPRRIGVRRQTSLRNQSPVYISAHFVAVQGLHSKAHASVERNNCIPSLLKQLLACDRQINI